MIHSQLYIKKLLPPSCRQKSLGKGQRDGLGGQGSAAKTGDLSLIPRTCMREEKTDSATCSLTSMFVLCACVL